MFNPRAQNIKREKKKSLYQREITALIQTLAAEEPDIAHVYVTRVDFSDDYGLLYVFFATYLTISREVFDRALEKLKLYKPSIRKAMAGRVSSRRAPDIKFFFDETKEKEFKIHQLLDKVSDELKNQEPTTPKER